MTAPLTEALRNWKESRETIKKSITVLRNESNRGIGYTRNKAIKNSTGMYIWFVDADDLLVPDTAVLYLDIAEKTGADVVLGKCMLWESDR